MEKLRIWEFCKSPKDPQLVIVAAESLRRQCGFQNNIEHCQDSSSSNSPLVSLPIASVRGLSQAPSSTERELDVVTAPALVHSP